MSAICLLFLQYFASLSSLYRLQATRVWSPNPSQFQNVPAVIIWMQANLFPGMFKPPVIGLGLHNCFFRPQGCS
ncbi:hypothetical protein K440DRAFT_387450 [Wilcoxina mikolae CBS 423.85]|nr:hypothetical protein K440DRAFT_387450 [Wilcoxina mikolae CBS 423.85]